MSNEYRLPKEPDEARKEVEELFDTHGPVRSGLTTEWVEEIEPQLRKIAGYKDDGSGRYYIQKSGYSDVAVQELVRICAAHYHELSYEACK